MRKLSTIFIVLMLIMSIFSASSAQIERAHSITVSGEYETMLPGQQQQMAARVYPEGTASQKVSWRSTNTGVATINENGLVRANRPGTTYITATATDGSKVSGSMKLTVIDSKVTKIEITAPYTDIIKGESVQLEAFVYPVNAENRNIEWKSSNPNIVTITSSGMITGKNLGTAMVTATAKDRSGVAARVRINVVDVKTSIVFDLPDNSIYVNDEIQLSPKLVITKNGTVSEMTDSLRIDNSNSLVASIDGNMVLKGLSEGETVITVISDRYRTQEAVQTVTVHERPSAVLISDKDIDGCTETAENVSAFIGDKVQLYGFVEDLTGSRPADCFGVLPAIKDQSLIWSSTNPDVAQVDQNGLVTVLQTGSTVINAQRPGKDVSASVRFDVSGLFFTIDSVKITKDDRYRVASYLEAPEDAQIVWASTDETVALVNESGLVRAVGSGEAYIIASLVDHPDITVSLLVEVPSVESAPTEEPESEIETSYMGLATATEPVVAPYIPVDSESPDNKSKGIHIVDFLSLMQMLSGNYY